MNEKINELVNSLTPVKPLKKPVNRLRNWVLTMAALTLAFIYTLGVRGDLVVQLKSMTFVTQIAALLLLTILSIGISLKASIPGESYAGLIKAAKITMIAIAAALLIDFVTIELNNHQILPHAWGWHCAMIVGISAIIPALTAAYWTKKGLISHSKRPLLWATTAAAALSLLTIHLICGYMAFTHLLIWHIAPSILIALSGLLLPND